MQVFFLQPKRHLFVDFPLLNKVLRLHANIFLFASFWILKWP